MAEVTLKRPDFYPTGTTVKAFKILKNTAAYPLESGEPKPSSVYESVAEATAGSTGTTLTGLTAGVKYVAWGKVGSEDHYLRFEIAAAASGGGTEYTAVSPISISGTEISLSAIGASSIAAEAVTEAKLAAKAVSEAKIATGVTERLAPSGGETGQALVKESATNYKMKWETIGGGGAPSGAAGGVLAGTYPNPGLAANAVKTAAVEALAVTEAKLAAEAVAAAKIATGAVTEAKLGAEAVSEGKIKAGAVTGAKIAEKTVTGGATGNIKAAAVTTTEIAEKTVTGGTTGNIAATTVTAGELASASVTAAKLGAEAVEAGAIKGEAVTAAKIATGAVTEAKLGALAVSEAKIAAEAVTAGKIATGAVTEAKIGTGAVTAAKHGAESVETSAIKLLAVTSGTLAGEAVTAAKIGSEAVETGKIKGSAVTAAKLASESVETTKIAGEAVTKVKLAAAVQEELEPKVTEHSFSIGSELKNEVIPGFFVKLGTHETKNLIGVEYELLEGTSAELEIQKANSGKSEAAAGIASYKVTELKAEKSTKRVSSSKALANEDRITLKVTSVTGTPKGLICTLFLESVK